MRINDWDIKEIENEDWKKAWGIKHSKGETNSALAPRDYSIKCEPVNRKIGVIKGYFIWWCSTHHQPLMWCKNDRLQVKIDELESKLNTIKEIIEE